MMNKNRVDVCSQRERRLWSVCSGVFWEPIWGTKLLYNFIKTLIVELSAALTCLSITPKLYSAIDPLEGRMPSKGI